MTKLTLISRHTPLAIKAHSIPVPAQSDIRVICATDLWGPSDHALEKALWLAETTHAKLMLLHVVEGETPLRLTGKRADHARNALQWRVRRWPHFKPRPAISVRVGKPHQLISRVAREWRADLVVLGASRPRWMDRFVPTTAERVATEADCAVLVVERSAPAAYSHATIVAESCCQAAALEHATDKLQILKQGVTPRKLHWAAARKPSRTSDVERWFDRDTWQRPSLARSHTQSQARSQVRSQSKAPRGLIILAADRWPALTGLLGRNAVSRLARSTVTDLLVWPHRKVLEELRFPGPDHECLDRRAGLGV